MPLLKYSNLKNVWTNAMTELGCTVTILLLDNMSLDYPIAVTYSIHLKVSSCIHFRAVKFYLMPKGIPSQVSSLT